MTYFSALQPFICHQLTVFYTNTVPTTAICRVCDRLILTHSLCNLSGSGRLYGTGYYLRSREGPESETAPQPSYENTLNRHQLFYANTILFIMAIGLLKCSIIALPSSIAQDTKGKRFMGIEGRIVFLGRLDVGMDPRCRPAAQPGFSYRRILS